MNKFTEILGLLLHNDMRKLKRRTFKSRLSGKPIKIKRYSFQWSITVQMNEMLRLGIITLETFDPLSPVASRCNEAIFLTNDFISMNGVEYAVGQRIIFG